MTVTQTMLDIAEEALYLLRQDVTLPTLEEAHLASGMEWVKTKKAIEFTLAEVLAAHDWVFARAEGFERDKVDGWPVNIRKVLVYALARELAVQIAGRTEDLKNWHTLYEKMLVDARKKDLSDEMLSLPDGIVPEAIYTVLMEFPKDEALPRSIDSLVRRAERLKLIEEKEILASYPWDFTEESSGENAEEWPADIRRCLVLKLAADLARVTLGGEAAATHEKIFRDALAEAKLRDARRSEPDRDLVWGANHYVEEMDRGRR